MLNWIIEQFSIPPDNLLLYGTYNSWLVALSVLIAIFASYMGLQVASQATQKVSNLRRHSMLGIGSVALGGGIWSMHFIGMLAFDLCTTVEYNLGITLGSMVPGVFASWVALNYINSHKKGGWSLLIGGVLVGAGIGTMHYSGMAAMEMAPLLRYEPLMFAVSIVVAVSLAMLSLWIYFGLSSVSQQRGIWRFPVATASVVMGCAITGMHYTGMAAARFVRPPGLELSSQSSEISIYLALGISIVTVVIICLVLGLNLIHRYKDISLKAAENERRMRAMMETAVDGIISINSDGAIISVNQATVELLGWSAEELLGENVNKLVPAPFHDEHDNYIQRYLDTGEASIIGQGREVDAVHKNGEAVAIRLAIGHVKLSNSDLFVAFITDIRPRIKMEQALRDNEAKFRSLITNIPGIAYRCKDSDDWPMIYISDAVECFTGYSAQDFLLPNPKLSFADLYHPEDRQRIFDSVSYDGAFNLEYRIITARGDVRWVMEQGNHVTDESSQESWIDGFIMDITERREMELALREAKESAEQAASARARFMANMSHEIRTPMNAIIGFSDILLETPLNNDQTKQLTTINNSAKSLLHLLNDILDSAKLDKGKLELEIRDFSLIQEVDEVVSTLWLEARNKGLDLTVEVSPQLNTLYSGSPDRIRQVMTNLLSNAVKFTQQGFVKVTVQPLENEFVNFTIADSGIGMTPEQLDKVFKAFTQADSSMSRRFGGTGLGTTISKQLVELMGGEIYASSEQNVGSTFGFKIPLHPPKGDVTEQLKGNVQLPPMSILVVDDIQQNIDLLSVLLERQGHTVVTARDGQQALIRMAQEEHLDLVIMDVQMPIMDGLTAATERRKVELEQGLERTPIIAFTASVLEEDRVAAINAGMDGFANKPVDSHALFSEMARVKGVDLSAEIVMSEPRDNATYIDDKKGIALWGSKQEYYHQLSIFVAQYADDFERLAGLLETGLVDAESLDAEALDTERWQEFGKLCHTLKGVTGNMSLKQLHRSLEQLERSAVNAKDDCAGLVANIQELYKKVASLVADTVEQSKQEQQSSLDVAAMLSLLQNIKLATAENEVDETAMLQLSAMDTGQYAAEITAVLNAINDFEFAEAGILCDGLIEKLS